LSSDVIYQNQSGYIFVKEMFMQNVVRRCPNCQHDYKEGEAYFEYSSIFEGEICEYCFLEIGLEFDLEGYGVHFTSMASKQCGIDIWQVRKRYLYDIIDKLKVELAGDLDADKRRCRNIDLADCNNQLKAIEIYHHALSTDDAEVINAAKADLEKAFETIAFDLSTIRGCEINYLVD
jgi:endogenous inhibitor of DNA gyrase (YacG/DUF329 family)